MASRLLKTGTPSIGLITSTQRPPQAGSIFQEQGATGLKHYSGRLYEEFLADLYGKRGVAVYREMSDNDAIVGASLFAIETLMRRATWRVDPASETDPADTEAADYVKDNMDDMEQSWADTMAEILQFLRYGWGLHEEVYKLRQGFNKDPRKTSKYDDGLIGWRKLPVRAQESLFRWEIDPDDGTIEGMWQQPPPTYQLRYVAMERGLLFRTSIYKNNPEGKSILRTAYRAWYFKRRMEEIEAIGLERDLAGMPVLTPPTDLDIFNESDPDMVKALQMATDLVTNIRRDELEGVVMPHGWTLSLLGSGGSHGGQTGQSSGRSGHTGPPISGTIQRYESHIAMSMLADFIMLGHTNTGTYALSADKTDMFNLAVNSHLDYVASVFNRWAIPRLIGLNPKFPQDRFPTLAHDGVDTPNMSEIGSYISSMTGIGILVPDPGLEDYVRSIGNLPTRPTEETEDEWNERHSLVPQEEMDDAQAETDDSKQAVITSSRIAVDAKSESQHTSQQSDLKVQQANLKVQQARLQATKRPAAKK